MTSSLILEPCHIKIDIKGNASIHYVNFQVGRTAVSSSVRVWARRKRAWGAPAGLPPPGCRRGNAQELHPEDQQQGELQEQEHIKELLPVDEDNQVSTAEQF